MASTIVQLADGHEAVIRDPLLITNGQRRPIVIAANRWLQQQITPEFAAAYKRAVAMKDEARLLELSAAAQIDQSELDVLKAGDVFITVMVESWTLDLPLPSEKPLHDDNGDLIGSAVLDELLAHDYDRLQVAAGSMINQTRWLGDPEPVGKARAPRAPTDRQRSARSSGSSRSSSKR